MLVQCLTYFGIPYIEAPSEGEATAAHLTNTGQAYASASQDFDSILCGAKRLIRNFTNSGRRKIPNRNTYIEIVPEIIETQKTLDSLGLTRKELIDLTIRNLPQFKKLRDIKFLVDYFGWKESPH